MQGAGGGGSYNYFHYFQVKLSLRQVMVTVSIVSELISDGVRILPCIIRPLLQVP